MSDGEVAMTAQEFIAGYVKLDMAVKDAYSKFSKALEARREFWKAHVVEIFEEEVEDPHRHF
jgi:hypothetical protein